MGLGRSSHARQEEVRFGLSQFGGAVGRDGAAAVQVGVDEWREGAGRLDDVAEGEADLAKQARLLGGLARSSIPGLCTAWRPLAHPPTSPQHGGQHPPARYPRNATAATTSSELLRARRPSGSSSESLKADPRVVIAAERVGDPRPRSVAAAMCQP